MGIEVLKPFVRITCILAVAVMPALAQTDAGALRVLVVDPTGSVIPGADVRVTNVETNASDSRASNEEGYANFSPLTRGRYVVDVALTGFKNVRIVDVSLDVQQNRLLRAVLDVAQVTESVEVSAQPAPVQTEEGSLGQVIRGEVAVELPLAGRRYTELALLIPGSSPSTMTVTTRGPGWFVSNGNYHTQNNFMLDGFDNNQGTQNAQSLSAQVVQPNPDAIDQFKVQTNSFSAEFGRSAGAVVNVSLKSGGNAVRGSTFYYNRDSSLAANSWNANTFGLPKDDLGWNQGGFTVGGPLVVNRLFYFGAYEGFRQTFTDSGVSTVATLAQRQGVFNTAIRDPLTGQPFPDGRIPQARWDPLGRKVLDLDPEPNRDGRAVAGGRFVDNYAWQRPGRENTHKMDVRSDFVQNATNRFFGRYSFLQQDIFRERLFPTLGEGTSNQGEQYNRNQSLGFSWSRVINSRIVNEARVGYNRTHSRFAHAAAKDPTADQFGFVGLPAEYLTTGGIPLIDFTNYTDLGIRNFRPQFQNPQTIQVLDTLSMALGRHNLRSGAEVRIKRNELLDVIRRSPAYRFTGEYTGDDVADLLIGLPLSLNATTVPIVDWRQEAYAAFVQDDWKLSPDFTLNLGLRYEYATPYYGAGQNRNINFDFRTGELVYPTDRDKYLMDTDRNNFGPRLGFAYQIRPDRLVVRGGYGMFYSLEDMRGSEGMIALNPPTLVDVTLQRTSNTAPPPIRLSDPFPAGLTDSANVNTTTVAVKARAQDQRAATVQQWNLATELLLPWQSTVEVAYVGNRGANLLGVLPVNGVPFGVNGAIAANRPYPNWRQIDVNITEAQSDYHALQLKLEKRQSRGLYLLSSYTYARAEDEIGAWGAGGSGAQIILRPDFSNVAEVLRGERGPNGQIARHRFTFTQVWQLPIGRDRAIGTNIPAALDALVGGWQVSSITSVRTGLPVNVTLSRTGTDPNSGQNYAFFDRNGGYLRPNLVGNANASSNASADRFAFLDRNAYAVPALNTPGNAPRNSAWGPGHWTTDLSLVKRVRFDRWSADVRAEAFNLFNHTNYDQPNTSFGTANFGSITGAGLPRIVQLALRVGF